MKQSIKLVFICIMLGFVPLTLACQFDTDCDIGSKCLKRGFSMYGICIGGMNPGNSHDQKPVYAPMHLEGNKYGNTCSNDFDCGFSFKCMKGSSALKGTCM